MDEGRVTMTLVSKFFGGIWLGILLRKKNSKAWFVAACCKMVYGVSLLRKIREFRANQRDQIQKTNKIFQRILKIVTDISMLDLHQCWNGVIKKLWGRLLIPRLSQKVLEKKQSRRTWRGVPLFPHQGQACSNEFKWRKIIALVGSFLWAHVHTNNFYFGGIWSFHIQVQDWGWWGVGCFFRRWWYADFTEQIPALVCLTCWSGLCVMIGRGVAVITWWSWGGMTKLDWSSCLWWSFMKEDIVTLASSSKRGPWMCVLRGPIGNYPPKTLFWSYSPQSNETLLTRDLIFTFHYIPTFIVNSWVGLPLKFQSLAMAMAASLLGSPHLC